MEEAHFLFDPLGVNVVLRHKLFGGVVDSPSENNQFVKECVHELVQVVDRLAKIAQVQPKPPIQPSPALSRTSAYISKD